MAMSPFPRLVAIPTSISGMVAQPTSGADAVPMVTSTSNQVCSGSVFALSDRAFKNRLKTYCSQSDKSLKKRNDNTIHVFALDENDYVFPLRMCEMELPNHRALLYISND